MTTITPHENDQREETPAAVEIAKPKPINCIASSGCGNRWGSRSQKGGRARGNNDRPAPPHSPKAAELA